uniref:RNA-dependent RNA polymerase n=1 Tax=Plasmopara viticola lesion associated narnavirus 35 TaxID=2719520 RepID=A0A6G9RWQ7_9VIRU|nr:RNA-dependent RNA polymerase [Plasmopara viticola lesion associated narnavirus 35]
MVFQHNCIPLSVQLRKERQSDEKTFDTDQEFNELLASISRALRTGEAPRSLTWTYDYANLFTTRVRGRPLHKHNKSHIVDILRRRTFWYNRLKSNMKLMVKHLIDRDELLKLKEILHTVDGVICQLIVSFPECLMAPDGHSAYTVTDQITNSIISSCLLNYSKVVREIKAFRKKFRRACFEKVPFPKEGYRHMSWLVPIIDFYNDGYYSRNSKEKMFRVCTFAQSRSTGLADKKMVNDTVQEFLDTVTTPGEFSPNETLLESIQEVTTDLVFDADSISAHFRASMSTSACKESSRKNEGKFGFLRKLVSDNIIPVPEEPSPENEGGTIGTPLWWRAFRKAKNRDADVFDVNVAGIRENGKCRVVTSGSFYKDVLLQPFSHLTIEMAKCNPVLEQGFKAARLGWEFILSVNNLDPKRGEILFEDEVSAMSFDLAKATDWPTHESGRAVMRPILEKMGLAADVIDVILDVWVGEKNLYRNKQFVGKMVRGIPMGDPLTKTNLSLVHPIASLYARKKIGRHIVVLGTGNGDDGNQIASGPLRYKYFDYFLEGCALLGYEISVDDTFITDDWMTYCEEVFRIPIDRFHTVLNSCRIDDSRISPYLDHPKGRLIIDTRKDRQDYSSDPKGKYTLMGKELEWVGKDGTKAISFLYSVSSAMQDVCLGLADRYEPVYLPRQIFGTGKPPPLWDVESWCNAIRSQRKWPKFLTISAMKETLGYMEANFTTLRGVVREQPHFAGEGVVEVFRIPEDDPIKKHRVVKADEWEKFPRGVIDKLVSGGRLVRESKLSGWYLFHKRMCGILTGTADLFEVARSMSNEVTEPTDEDIVGTVSAFVNRYKGRPWTLKQVFTEDIYNANIIEVMNHADPLRVDMPDFNYLKRFGRKPKSDTPYQRELDRLELWFDDNYEDILAGREYELPPRAVIEDDDVLLMEVERSPSILHVLVTDDIKLCKRIARRNQGEKIICRISCYNWVFHSAAEHEFKKCVVNMFHIDPEFHVDFGSLDTFNEVTGSTYSYGIPATDPLIRNWEEDVPRRPPASQASIYSKFKIRPKIDEKVINDTIEVVSRRNSLITGRFRAPATR